MTFFALIIGIPAIIGILIGYKIGIQIIRANEQQMNEQKEIKMKKEAIINKMYNDLENKEN